MRLTRRFFSLCLGVSVLWVLPVSAQYQASSTKLSPYEEQLYGSSLWAVPREPYKGDFERYKARTYIPPEDDFSKRSSTGKLKSRQQSSPVDTSPARSLRAGFTVKKRFQNEMKFKEDQRKISERSRLKTPSGLPSPVLNRIYGSGQSPANDR